MLIAITRSPGPELARCELTHLPRQPIDCDRAAAQHAAYQNACRDAGAHLIELPADPSFPDGVFVEDTAVVLDEVAVVATPGVASRQGEQLSVANALRPYRTLLHLPAGVTLEGGDVLRLGRTLYVGLSGRTGEAGLRALEEVVRPYGYRVEPVLVRGCLHLKSGCTALDSETVLINRDWVSADSFGSARLVDVPAGEPGAANVLSLSGVVLVSKAYPQTWVRLRGLGYATVGLDVSEIHKAEAGLTCMSLVFNDLEK
jgi:dimethylargininase